MIVIANVELVNIINALIAEDGSLDALECHLYQNDVFPDPTLSVAQFDEADYTGYAAQTPVEWNPAFLDTGNIAQTVGETLQFQPSGTTVGNVVYGYWLERGTGNLVLAERLPAPVVLDGPLKALVLIPRFTLGQPTA